MKRVYSPKISPHLVKKLYWLRKQEGVPMTVLADRAISAYIAKKEQKGGELKDDSQTTASKKTPKGKKTKVNSSGTLNTSGNCDCISFAS